MKIAAIGDIHGFWDAHDTEFFNKSDYDAMLFVGDLPRLTGGMDIARELARLNKPAWLIPGNHDGCTALQLLSEIKNWSTLCRVGAAGMAGRVGKLAQALGPVRMGGYETFALDSDLGLITARPHAMGPDRFYYRHYMQRQFGVGSFSDSAEKLKVMIDNAPRRLIFLAHNGPAGLGEHAQDIWGCDFSPEFGDFGDPDLRDAIGYAVDSGHEVLAVIGGHMHLQSKTGGRRNPTLTRDSVLYVNAAEVARIRKNGAHRHHVSLQFDGDNIAAETIWVNAEGAPTNPP